MVDVGKRPGKGRLPACEMGVRGHAPATASRRQTFGGAPAMNPSVEFVRSAANPRLRQLLALSTRARERRAAGAAVIEGVHLLEAWLSRHGRARLVFVPEQAPPAVMRLARAAGAPVIELEAGLFARASQLESSSGPIAIVDMPRPALPATISTDLVYLDRIQDPGNVGSIIRSCAALGVSLLATAPGTASCWAPKVLRAGQGAHFALTIHENIAWAELQARTRVALRYASADGGSLAHTSDLRAPAVWVFGNEGEGVAPAIRASLPGAAIAIAQTSAVESFNVGVAAALCLYEQWRQRGCPGASPSC